MKFAACFLTSTLLVLSSALPLEEELADCLADRTLFKSRAKKWKNRYFEAVTTCQSCHSDASCEVIEDEGDLVFECVCRPGFTCTDTDGDETYPNCHTYDFDDIFPDGGSVVWYHGFCDDGTRKLEIGEQSFEVDVDVASDWTVSVAGDRVDEYSGSFTVSPGQNGHGTLKLQTDNDGAYRDFDSSDSRDYVITLSHSKGVLTMFDGEDLVKKIPTSNESLELPNALMVRRIIHVSGKADSENIQDLVDLMRHHA